MIRSVHVTRIGASRECYGHNTKHCDPAGCNGTEQYFADAEMLGAVITSRDCAEDDDIHNEVES